MSSVSVNRLLQHRNDLKEYLVKIGDHRTITEQEPQKADNETDDAEGKEVEEEVEVQEYNPGSSAESRMRYPNDLIVQMKESDRSDGVTKSNDGDYESAGDGEESDDEEEEKEKEKKQRFTSTVPGMINIQTSGSVSEMTCNLKYGYSDSVRVPVTCLGTGVTRVIDLKPGKTVLVDRPLGPHTWVRHGDKIGFITDIKSKVDLEIYETGLAIKGISEADFTIVPEFYPRQYIFHRTWIGCVMSVKHKLHIKFEKGHECYIYADTDNSKNTHRKLYERYPGQFISMSGSDVSHAEWIKYPGVMDWFFLRYLNTNYSENSLGKIIKNEVHEIRVSWLQSTFIKTNPDDKIPSVPAAEISGKPLKKIKTLDLPNKYRLWYGVLGKYRIRKKDRIGRCDDWEDLKRLSLSDGEDTDEDTDEYEEEKTVASKPSEYRAGTEVIAEVIARYATASVLWMSGKSSELSVTDLVPFYPMPGQPFPVSPGSLVKLRQFQKADVCLKYGVVETVDVIGGEAQVKWLESESKDSSLLTKLWNSSEPLHCLEGRKEFSFPLGLIVISKKTRSPGVIVGNDLRGNFLVKIGARIEKLPAYAIEKFDNMAYISQKDKVYWFQRRESKMINQKHLAATPWSKNYGNLIPPPASLLCDRWDLGPLKTAFRIEPPDNHKFIKTRIAQTEEQTKEFIEIAKVQITAFEENPVQGVWIRNFSERPNLFSILVKGGQDTVHEFGLYSFDICLPWNYPTAPPLICYRNSDHPDFCVDLGLPDDGMLNIDELFDDQDKNLDYSLTNVLKMIRDSLEFGDFTSSGGMTLLPYESYTREYSVKVKNQETFRDVIRNIQHLLCDPPNLWEQVIWNYYQLEIPRIVARVKEWLTLSESILCADIMNSETISVESSGLWICPFDPVIGSELKQEVQNLSESYSRIY